MRLIIFTAVLLITLSMPAMAQEAPDVEVFGGYSFIKLEGETGLHGWNASVAGNLSRSFAVVVDFSGHYGSQSFSTDFSLPGLPATRVMTDVHTNLHTILGGPRFAYRRQEKITPFAHALFGALRWGTNATLSANGLTREQSLDSTAFAAAFGGGLDLKLNKNVSFRMLQADYLLTHFGGRIQNNARLSVGIVLH